MKLREPFFPNAAVSLYKVGGFFAAIYMVGVAAVNDYSWIVGIIFGIGGYIVFGFAGGFFRLFNLVAFPLSAFLVTPPNSPVFYLGIGVGVGSFGIFLLTQFRPVVSEASYLPYPEFDEDDLPRRNKKTRKTSNVSNEDFADSILGQQLVENIDVQEAAYRHEVSEATMSDISTFGTN